MRRSIVVKTPRQMAWWAAQMQWSGRSGGKADWQRRHCRLTMDASGTTDQKASPTGADPMEVTTHDLSAHGLSFLSEYPLPENQHLTIAIETGDGEIAVPATVCRCAETFGMFTIQVRFNLHDHDGPKTILPHRPLATAVAEFSLFDLSSRMIRLFSAIMGRSSG